jgi:hypothetical protein
MAILAHGAAREVIVATLTRDCPSQTDANARLISAAPDYDRETRHFVEWVCMNVGMRPDHEELMVWAERFAAINAKARP